MFVIIVSSVFINFEVQNKCGRNLCASQYCVHAHWSANIFVSGQIQLYRNNNNFDSAKCLAGVKQRSHIVRHIRAIRVVGQNTTLFSDANEFEGIASKNFVHGFDRDAFEAIHEGDDFAENTKPNDNYSCSA